MPVIQGGQVAEGLGLGSPLTNAGAPVAGTNEVQTVAVTGSPAGGTFKLKFNNKISGAIAHNADAATVQAALEALATIGSGNVAASGTLAGGMTITFQADLGRMPVPALILAENSLTGGTSPNVTVTETTPGVAATHRGAPKGAKLVDTTNGIDYINTGTPVAPTWTKTGTQT